MGRGEGAQGNKMLKIRQVRSAIGRPRSHRQTLRGLGLTRLNKSVVLKDTPPIRGMISKVRHLVRVEEIEAGPEVTKERSR